MNLRILFRVGFVLMALPMGGLCADDTGGLLEIGQPSTQTFASCAFGYGALTNDQQHVAAYVAGTDSQRIRVGSKADVRLEGMPDDSAALAGVVTELLREADPRTHQSIATVQIPRQTFSPRTYAHIQIQLSSRQALAVPTTAIVWMGGTSNVFKQKDKNDFDPIKVEVGQQTPAFTEIKRGLNPGDKILIQGAVEWASKQSGGEAD